MTVLSVGVLWYGSQRSWPSGLVFPPLEAQSPPSFMILIREVLLGFHLPAHRECWLTWTVCHIMVVMQGREIMRWECFVICLTRFLSFWGGGNLSSGEDPLAGDQNDHDMDSIAGVLKLYFRGLEQPLFPKDIFHDLIACVSKYYTPRMAARYLEISISLLPHKLFSKVFLSLFLPESFVSSSPLFYPWKGERKDDLTVII